MNMQQIKIAIGQVAADLVEDGMIIGLGSGSTAACFIDSLALRCQEGLSIQAVASSIASQKQAEKGKIPLLSVQDVKEVDITFDGADQIDPEKRLIKGYGGAFFREKVLASMSKEMVVLVDQTKLVHYLGNCLLPIEIVSFGCEETKKKLLSLNYEGDFRKKEDGSYVVTDNGNYIYDIRLDEKWEYPEEDHKEIKEILGVIETGFFAGYAGRVVVGYSEDKVEILT